MWKKPHNWLIAAAGLLIIVLLTGLFVANGLCLHFMPTMNIWLSSLLRSLLIVIVAWLAYRWQLSPELNQQIYALLHRVRL